MYNFVLMQILQRYAGFLANGFNFTFTQTTFQFWKKDNTIKNAEMPPS